MKRRRTPLTITILALIAAVCLMIGTSPAAASDRAETFQFYFPLTYTGSESFNAENGTTVDLASDIGWGFAFGYNFTERWNIGFEATWMDRSFEADIRTDDPMEPFVRLGGTLDTWSLGVVGQFNFMETRVTPFIRAGLSSTWADSNIPSGPPTGTCWWHPWWGPICGAWQPTHDARYWSYSAGIGVRADLGEAFYLELSYNSMWLDVDRGSNPNFLGGRLNVGWAF